MATERWLVSVAEPSRSDCNAVYSVYPFQIAVNDFTGKIKSLLTLFFVNVSMPP